MSEQTPQEKAERLARYLDGVEGEYAGSSEAIRAVLAQIAKAEAEVTACDGHGYLRDLLKQAEAERDAAQRDLAHQEDLTDRQRARTAELERGLAEAEAERDALRAAHHDAAAQWQEEARLRREAQGEAERLREWNARLLSQATVAEEEARQAQAEVERLRLDLEIAEPKKSAAVMALAARAERAEAALKATQDMLREEEEQRRLARIAAEAERAKALDALREAQDLLLLAYQSGHRERVLEVEAERDALWAELQNTKDGLKATADHRARVEAERDALWAGKEIGDKLLAGRDRQIVALRADLSRTLAEVERPFRERIERAEAALRELTGWAGDLAQGWEAHRKLASGFGGMGYNILTETAARYGSMTYWNRLAKAVEQARAALPDIAPEPKP